MALQPAESQSKEDRAPYYSYRWKIPVANANVAEQEYMEILGNVPTDYWINVECHVRRRPDGKYTAGVQNTNLYKDPLNSIHTWRISFFESGIYDVVIKAKTAHDKHDVILHTMPPLDIGTKETGSYFVGSRPSSV